MEQDADMVMFIYRPEYYGIDSNDNGESTAGETHIKIAKHRNGSLGNIRLRAKLHIQKFVDLDDDAPVVSGLPSNFKPVRSFGEPIKKDEDDETPF